MGLPMMCAGIGVCLNAAEGPPRPHTHGCVLVRPDDDLALTLGENLPAECLGPEPGQPRQVVSLNDDVMESDRHASPRTRQQQPGPWCTSFGA